MKRLRWQKKGLLGALQKKNSGLCTSQRHTAGNTSYQKQAGLLFTLGGFALGRCLFRFYEQGAAHGLIKRKRRFNLAGVVLFFHESTIPTFWRLGNCVASIAAAIFRGIGDPLFFAKPSPTPCGLPCMFWRLRRQLFHP